MIKIKDPVVLFERKIEDYFHTSQGEVMPPWNQWLLYYEASKAKGTEPLSFFAWSQLQGIQVEPDGDDAA